MTSQITQISNSFIHLRETAFNFIFSTSKTFILNPQTSRREKSDPIQLVTDIKTTINNFKQAAMDETGSHVNYSLLQDSQPYHYYTNELIPQLHNLDLSRLNHYHTALSFWINLYNAMVIHAVIEFGVTISISEKGPQNLIRFFRQAAYSINGQRFSLEDIEHGVIRANKGQPYFRTPQFSSKDSRISYVIEPLDPRIHFALNCAAKSCPPINVYTSDQLDQHLTTAAKNFISQETQLKNNQLWVSSIFKWYQRDFNDLAGVSNFIKEHLPNTDPRHTWLTTRPKNKLNLKYLPYNWRLNI